MSKLNPQKAVAYVGPGVLKQGSKITPVPDGHLIKKTGKFKGSTLKSGGKIKKAKSGAASTTTTETSNPIGVKFFKEGKNFKAQVTKKVGDKNATYEGISPNMDFAKVLANDKALINPADSLRTRKNGGMLKRADGSYSKRGLWDNIRANKGSGKKPTKQMLQQEKKINAKSKK
jgi:hypothetical protein